MGNRTRWARFEQRERFFVLALSFSLSLSLSVSLSLSFSVTFWSFTLPFSDRNNCPSGAEWALNRQAVHLHSLYTLSKNAFTMYTQYKCLSLSQSVQCVCIYMCARIIWHWSSNLSCSFRQRVCLWTHCSSHDLITRSLAVRVRFSLSLSIVVEFWAHDKPSAVQAVISRIYRQTHERRNTESKTQREDITHTFAQTHY